MSRREMIAAAGGAIATGIAPARASNSRQVRIRFCLNTATLRGCNIDLPETVDIAARAGYHGIEPWLDEIERYTSAGGSLPDLARRIRDHGLAVENAIAFPEWISDDDHRRAAGLESARRAMDTVRALGCTRIAAPPAGATDVSLDPRRVAERYRALLDAGEQAGVLPILEIWGFSHTLGRLGDAAYVAADCGRSDATILADVFHLYRGGSPFEGLRVVSGHAMPVFHMNDYPVGATKDAERVLPGDGVAPFSEILGALTAAGFSGVYSLELFNPVLWKQDPLTIARTGLRKMKAVVTHPRGTQATS
jgi:2-keto-myo-inositol isomerase